MRPHDLFAYLEMLEDDTRVSAYKKAIDLHCPGKIVLDLGAGPGILSHLALRAGAKKVYAIEVDRDPLMIGYRLAQEMGYGDRFVPLLAPSVNVNLPLEAEVLVSETFDSFGMGEGAPWLFKHALSSFCLPSAVIIPNQLRVDLALGASPAVAAVKRRFREAGVRHDLDYRPIDKLLPPIGLVTCGEERFTSWVTWFKVELGREDFPRHVLVPFSVWNDGVVDSILGEFDIDLCEGVRLSTSAIGEYPETHWRRGALPLPVAFEVHQGDQFVLELTFDGEGLMPRFKYVLTKIEDFDAVPGHLAEVLRDGWTRTL